MSALAAAGVALVAAPAAFGQRNCDTGPFDEDMFCDLGVQQTGSSAVVKKGQEVTYTVKVTNHGEWSYRGYVEMYAFRAKGERPVDNPYASFSPSQGSCFRDRWETKFGIYHYLKCALGSIAAGADATVKANVTVNESTDHWASLVGCEEGPDWQCGPTYDYNSGNDHSRVRTFVDAPPQVSGSSAIKVRGLPQGCISEDFTFRVQARKAKKIVAVQRGPLTVLGKPTDNSQSRKLKPSKGSTMKIAVVAEKLASGYHEIRVASKYRNGPKQKAAILFQTCEV